jgi:hypothetical protein
LVLKVLWFCFACRVKFGAFLEYLGKEHAGRFDRIASGHYARLIRGQDAAAAVAAAPEGAVAALAGLKAAAAAPKAAAATEGAGVVTGRSLANDVNAMQHHQEELNTLTERQSSHTSASTSSSTISRASNGSSSSRNGNGSSTSSSSRNGNGSSSSSSSSSSNQSTPDAPPVLLAMTPDALKDQTYFLAHLSPQQLSRAMFPLGGFTKPQVRGYIKP